jgi:hypothetical protein
MLPIWQTQTACVDVSEKDKQADLMQDIATAVSYVKGKETESQGCIPWY